MISDVSALFDTASDTVYVGEPGQLSGYSAGPVIERSLAESSSGRSGGIIFFSRVSFLC